MYVRHWDQCSQTCYTHTIHIHLRLLCHSVSRRAGRQLYLLNNHEQTTPFLIYQGDTHSEFNWGKQLLIPPADKPERLRLTSQNRSPRL